MEFVIPAGSAANLPKELVDKIVDLAVEKSIILKLTSLRDQYIEIVNEGTIPVLGEEDLTKFFRVDTTTDITTLTEASFDIKHPDLKPVEVGTHMYLKAKQVKQYPKLKLDRLFRNRLGRGIARLADKVGLIGDTTAVGATNALNITNGIATLAASALLCATTPVTYSTSNSQAVINAVAEALTDIGVYGNPEYLEDLVLLASPDFVKTAMTSANKDYIGYGIDDYKPLGLKKVIHLQNVPLLKRQLLTGEQAILVNLRGAFCGYYGNMAVDVEHKAGRRADLLVITFWFDFKWGLLNSSSKALGMVKISKSS